MKRIKVLRQRKADLITEAGRLTVKEDAGTITAEETARLDAITKDGGELDQVNASIAREERLMDERRSMEAVRDTNDDTDEEIEDRLPAQARRPVEGFANFGEQLVAIARAAEPGMSSSDRDRRLVWQGPGNPNHREAASGQNEASGEAGGFLVQQDFAQDLVQRVYERAQLASRARRIGISANANGLRINALKESSRANGSRFGGIQAFWTGEGAQKPASQLKFRQMDLKLHKLTGLLYATDELLEDASALEAVINGAFDEEFPFKTDDAIMWGTGAGMPLGFMNSDALVTVPKESGQGADTVVIENIVKMWARMWGRSRLNAIWTINQQIEPQLMTMKIGDTPIYMPNKSADGSPFSMLLGRPIVPTEFNSALGDKGDISLVDMSQYLLIDKGAVKKDVSIHVRFIYDETTFRFVLRIDGQPVWDAPLTPYRGSDTLSPFITLAERA